MEIVSKDNISLHNKANSWQEAIKKAGELLVDKGSISEKYIDMMVNSVNELGPYIVLTKGFALAHSAPCKEVFNNDLSVAIFDDDIDFNSDKGKVRVVMALACKDGQTHVDKLSKIARKLIDKEDFVDLLINAKSVEEVYDLLNK